MEFGGLIKRSFDFLSKHAENKTLSRKIFGDKAMDHVLGVNPEPPATPEAETGHFDILAQIMPKMAGKMVDSAPEERAQMARFVLSKQIQEDPDSLFHILGANKIKDHFRKQTDELSDLSREGF